MPENRPIVVVEDNPGDIRLVEEAFHFCRNQNPVTFITDGEQAYSTIFDLARSGSAPAFVLLDLNLPEIGGFDILADIKQSETTRTIPVVIFSASGNPDDLKKAQENFANAYVVKPMDIDLYFSCIRKIHNFWVEVVFSGEA